MCCHQSQKECSSATSPRWFDRSARKSCNSKWNDYGMRPILSRPPHTVSAELRKTLVTTNRELKSVTLALVYQCAHGQGPEYMREVFRTNEAAGIRMTRGCKKLHVVSVNTELYRKLFAMKGTQEWNSLPDDLRGRQSVSSACKKTLRGTILMVLSL